ncbi:UNVERIFIED_CONTAM: hypothetical protein Scaly_0857300 [Sesamum calycinum]|uniref:Retrotransposon gag domain-containing protein n=1 Tax=Sesamum calycinum TaxID=2727403 RepID=A0AAW2QUX2_9LAMI
MGSRRVVVTQANSTARILGQDAESPRHAVSPSERATNPEEENSPLIKLVMNLEEKVSFLETEITVLNSELDECREVVQEMASAFRGGGIVDMRCDMEQMSIQIGLLQRAVSNVPIVAHDPGARLWILEPKAYGGARDVKEVENFLFDMEQYFLAANVEDKTLMRKVIREQFFLENVEYNSRWALRKLEHTGIVRDYVKAFSTLMLDIRDMSENEKLFTFMEGLKLWACLELQCQ